jgi:serine protease Do
VVRFVRDGREQHVPVKLAGRPVREAEDVASGPAPGPEPRAPKTPAAGVVGLTVRDLSRGTLERFHMPADLKGALVAEVEPLSPADEADVRHGEVILEVNRQRVTSAADYRRFAASARPGDVLALYVYLPDTAQRAVRTLRVEAPDGGAPKTP